MRKKIVFIILSVFLAAGLTYADRVALVFGSGFNYGVGDFFEKSELHLSYQGKNFLETRENKLGVGFNAGLDFTFLKRIHFSPGVNIVYSHQHFEYNYLSDPSIDTDRQNYYFYLFSLEFNAGFDFLQTKKNWNMEVIAGLNYNSLKTDTKMLEKNRKFWGIKMGLGLRIIQLKHIGFIIQGFYQIPLAKDLFSHLTARAGVMYRF